MECRHSPVMTDFPNIIESKIISQEYNDLWSELKLPATVNEVAKTLVLCAAYAAGGAAEMQLTKMMQACKLTETDYNTIQVEEGKAIAWHQLRDALKPKYVVLLGVHPQQLGISALFHLFAPTRFNDTIWIAGPSLQDLEKQPEAKKQLWLNGLKPVFVDNATN
ncbi:hypothetical protein [Polluticoccus soli]|uniref:hypothetical protein n=1 Tax=Polluticoccus soli TaxID=3034150 RepID=UPI0023E298E6|nr:hypothetical protein [Flavipsychrobacter sp. JY13-12]